MSKKNLITPQIIIVVVLFSCFFTSFNTISEAENRKLVFRIYVVNYPLQYFAQRIGGDKVNVFFPAPPDIDPAFWTPGREVIRQYQKADLILLNGAGYAKWISNVTLPKSKLIDTSRSFKSEYIPLQDTITHSHGPKGEHAHGDAAFTTWLDPLLAVKQADSIKEVLIKLQPGQKDIFVKNYESLKNDLENLNVKIKQVVSKSPIKPLLASHPVYQYLARRYGLNIKSVHWEPDQVPGQEELQELDIVLQDNNSKWMIWESEPTEETKNILRKMGIQSVVFNPCSNDPGSEDYMEAMNKNVDNLKEVFN